MATLDFFTGFEHQVVTVSAAATSAPLLWTEVGTTQSISTTAGKFRSGAASLRINPSNATGYVSHPLSTFRVIGVLYVKFDSLPSGADCRICSTFTSAGGQIIGVDTNGKWYAESGGGTRVTDSVGPSTGQWYRIDFDSNTAADPHWLDWSVNGVAKTRASGSTAADTQDSILFGTTQATTVDMYLDDCAISITAGDYPIGGTYVLGFLPNADGSHSNQANFQDAGNTAISGVNPAYDQMDAVPLSSRTEYITQTANGTGDYVEVAFPNSSETAPIRAVQVTCAASADTTSTENAGHVLRDGSSDGTVFNGDTSQTSDVFLSLCFATKPSGGAWTDAAFDALTFRFGYSSDANPDPHCGGVILEVAYAEPGVYNESISLGAGGGVATARQTQQRPTMALGVGAGGSFAGGKALQGALTLGAGGGLGAAASQGYLAALSLAAGLGLTAASRADFAQLLTLGAGLHYGQTSTANQFIALTLGAGLGISAWNSLGIGNKWIATLDTGENLINQVYEALGSLWLPLETIPGKLVCFNPADQTWTTLTFPNSGDHLNAPCTCVTYIPAKGKIYVGSRTSSTLLISEVDPVTKDYTDVVSDALTDSSNGFVFDDTYIYVAMRDDIEPGVARYKLSDWSFDGCLHIQPASAFWAAAITKDASNIYAASLRVSGPGVVVRIGISAFTIDDSFTFSGTEVSGRGMAVTATSLWVPLTSGRIAKFDKTNLAAGPTYIDTGIKSAATAAEFDGTWVWVTYYSAPGLIVRIDPTDNSWVAFHVSAGQNNPYNIHVDATTGRVYLGYFLEPAKLSAHWGGDVFSEAIAFGGAFGLSSIREVAYADIMTLGAILGIGASPGANTFNENIAFSAAAGFSNSAKADLLAAFAFGCAASYINEAADVLALAFGIAASLGISAAGTAGLAGSLSLGASGSLSAAARTDLRPALSLNTALETALASRANLQAQASLGMALGLSLTPGAQYYNAITTGAALALAAGYSANEFFATVELAASLGLTPLSQLAAQANFSAAIAAGLASTAKADFESFLTLAASLGISASLAQNIYQAAMDLAVSVGYTPTSKADFRPVASLGVAASTATEPRLQIGASFALGLGAAMAAAGRMDYQTYLQLAGALGINASLAEQAYYESIALSASLGSSAAARTVFNTTVALGTAEDLTVAPSLSMAVALGLSSSVGLNAERYLSFTGALALGLVSGFAVAPMLDAQPVLALGTAAGLSIAAQADLYDAVLLAMQAGCSLQTFASLMRTFTIAASLGLDAFSIAGILPTPTDYLDAAYGVDISLNVTYRLTETLQANFGPDDRLEAWF